MLLKYKCQRPESIRNVIRRSVYGRGVYSKVKEEDAEIIREILYNEK